MTKMSSLRLPTLAAACALLALPALGEDSPSTPSSSSSGSVTIGAEGGSGIDQSSKLQEYEIVPKGVALFGASYSWLSRDGYFLDFQGTKLGLDDQFASLSGGKSSLFKLTLSWDQNPNWMSNTARTPYTETAPGVFHVPDGMRQALQNIYTPWVPGTASNPAGIGSSPANPTVPGFFAVDPWVSQAPPIDLRYVRKTGKAGLDLNLTDDLTLKLGYSREARDGDKATTFYAGSANYEVATPIAFRTHDLRAEAEFARGRVVANAVFDYSKFLNDVQYATIDNPERLELTSPITGRKVINDAATFRLWLPPDNQAYTLDLTSGVRLGAGHKITGTLSTGKMSMDRDLLPLSTNPDLATSATAPDPSFTIVPPESSVSVKYNTFLGSLRLTGDPIAKLGYSVNYRKFQITDKTGEYEFLSTVRGDVGAGQRVEGGTGESAPLVREHEGFSTSSLKGEVHLLPVMGLRLGVSYGEQKRDYDLREYANVEDKELTLTADYSHKLFSAHAGYTDLKREPGAQVELPTWQGATQTDISNTHRHLSNGLITLTPVDTLSVSVSGLTQRNDFPESVTGLLDQSADQLGVDVAYAPTAKLTVTAGYSYEKYHFNMAAAYFPRGVTVPPDFNPKADPNYWEDATTDKVDTFRASLKWTLKPEKLDLDADFDYTKPRSDSRYTFAPGGAGEANGIWPAAPVKGFPTADLSVPTSFNGFPLVSKNFLVAKVRLNYRVDKNLTASAMYWKQKLDNVDWATSVMPYMGRVDPGANRWFFLGAQVPSYDADIFRVSLSYKF